MLATFTVNSTGGLVPGATLHIGDETYDIPDRLDKTGFLAPARISAAVKAAGYQPLHGDYYAALRGPGEIEVEPR